MPDARHTTIRLLMFEIYEVGQDFPLIVTSDSVEAKDAMGPDDRLVKRYWVREGRQGDTP